MTEAYMVLAKRNLIKKKGQKSPLPHPCRRNRGGDGEDHTACQSWRNQLRNALGPISQFLMQLPRHGHRGEGEDHVVCQM
jgi:hypothetical protein